MQAYKTTTRVFIDVHLVETIRNGLPRMFKRYTLKRPSFNVFTIFLKPAAYTFLHYCTKVQQKYVSFLCNLTLSTTI